VGIIRERPPMDWAEQRAGKVVDEMLEYARLRAGSTSKAEFGIAHMFIAQALREAERRGREAAQSGEQDRSSPD
jgi:hypothetical protein